MPSERQLPGGGRCGQLPSSSVQSRANGAWGPHTPATTGQLSLHTYNRDTVSCPWSCRQEKQSCRTNILRRNTRTYRRGTAQELRGTQTFRQHSSRVETHSRSTQTNTPTGTDTYTQSSGEGTVGRSHERIRQPLCVTGIPFPHMCREPVSLGKARAGSGSSPPSGWSPPWSTTGFSSPGEQGTLRRALLHLRKASAFTPAHPLPSGLALPSQKKARQKRGKGAGGLRLPGPPRAKPLSSTTLGPALARGPRRLHVPGELPTPRPMPALRPGPRAPAPQPYRSQGAGRWGGGAKPAPRGPPRAPTRRRGSAELPGAATALRDDRGQRAEPRGGPGDHQPGGEKGERAGGRSPPAGGWRAKPSGAERAEGGVFPEWD